jgi:hypothetical protein
MPHASTFMRISSLKFKCEKHLVLEFSYDEVFGAKVTQLLCAPLFNKRNRFAIHKSDDLIDPAMQGLAAVPSPRQHDYQNNTLPFSVYPFNLRSEKVNKKLFELYKGCKTKINR